MKNIAASNIRKERIEKRIELIALIICVILFIIAIISIIYMGNEIMKYYTYVPMSDEEYFKKLYSNYVFSEEEIIEISEELAIFPKGGEEFLYSLKNIIPGQLEETMAVTTETSIWTISYWKNLYWKVENLRHRLYLGPVVYCKKRPINYLTRADVRWYLYQIEKDGHGYI